MSAGTGTGAPLAMTSRWAWMWRALPSSPSIGSPAAATAADASAGAAHGGLLVRPAAPTDDVGAGSAAWGVAQAG
jgi:hypothetical protein